MRRIITPADPGAAALDALKQWLAISTHTDDVALVTLLHAAIDMCEGFTGTIPLSLTAEETLPIRNIWHCLNARPVHAIIGADVINASGNRTPLPPDAYDLELDGDGTGRVRITTSDDGGRIAIRYIAGLAAEWAEVPEALRHGIIRLAAQLFRERDVEGETSASRVPPAAVAALWQPWRRLRVA
ncbi:MAG: hypothetical protein WA908_01750 [Pontixanthobacter sp.]